MLVERGEVMPTSLAVAAWCRTLYSPEAASKQLQLMLLRVSSNCSQCITSCLLMISFLLIAISAIVSDPRKAVLLNLKDVEILEEMLETWARSRRKIEQPPLDCIRGRKPRCSCSIWKRVSRSHDLYEWRPRTFCNLRASRNAALDLLIILDSSSLAVGRK